MSNGREFDKPGAYKIRVKAMLDGRWSDWFDGWTIVPQPNRETLLKGTVTDQLALHSLLTKIRDLGLPLLSLQRVDPSEDARDTASQSRIPSDKPKER
jgi:hypothetical protein